ncbi:MAG: hypothetical protein HWD92_10230 [Flavobacteriia bacterium]|nr:hypothetical protein [Flavobacteriia bacterium]
MSIIRRRTDIFWYFLAIFLVAGSNFATTALLVDALGSEEFAIWAKMEPILLLVLPMCGLGIQIGMMNSYQSDSSSPYGLLVPHVSLALTFAIFIAGLMYFNLHVRDSMLLSIACGGCIFLEGTLIFFVSYWRVINRPKMYAFYEGGRSTAVCLALFLASSEQVTLLNTVLGFLVLRISFAALFLIGACSSFKVQYSFSSLKVKSAIRYGLPIVVSSSFVSVVMNFDRYGVPSGDDVALTAYVAHVKLAQILGSAVAPFFSWFAPIAIAKINDSSVNDGFVGSVLYWFLVVDMMLAAGLWLFSPALWSMIFPGLTYDFELMAALIFGIAVFSIGNPMSLGTLVNGKTHYSMIITAIASLVGLLVYLLVGYKYGLIGIALSKLTAFGVYAALFIVHTWRNLKIEVNWLALVIVFGVTLFLSVFLVDFTNELGVVSAFFCSGIIVTIVPTSAFIILYTFRRLVRS